MTTDLLGDAQWRCSPTEAGSVVHPSALSDQGTWFEAQVPGTVASALRTAGVSVPDVDAVDWWFITTVAVDRRTPLRLELTGLATRTGVWVDGIEVAYSDSMFVPVVVDIEPGGDTVAIALRFESLAHVLSKRMPRGRWRSSMISQQGLRHVRTTWLGRAPVYGRLQPVVGPWRPVRLRARPRLADITARTALIGRVGRVTVTGRSSEPGLSIILCVGDIRREFVSEGLEFRGVIEVPDAELWWPHTHGSPILHDLRVFIGDELVHATRIGFRTVEARRDRGDFRMVVNAVPIFCRGVCWTPTDPIRMWEEPEVLRSALMRMRDAGLNMIRLVGTHVYEQDEFWSYCAEFGILVWQDIMLATIDPPEDQSFLASLEAEMTSLFESLASNPALAVVSGGSETLQQPTLLGLTENLHRIEILETIIPDAVHRELPGVPYVPSSPSGESGSLHTSLSSGTAHYFGVGGYLRPLSDVRMAKIRFATECLAFSVPPERKAVDRYFGSANVAGHHPDWKAAVPRDRGSSWDFEDVRDHYVRTLFGVDPYIVRRSDPERYLDLGRAAVTEAVAECFGYWRSRRSLCSGALVLTGRDLEAGAGWGLLDVDGAPKAPWFALARASSRVAVLISDEGLDGLTIEVVNDGPDELQAVLKLTAHSETGPADASAEIEISVGSHSSREWTAEILLDGFKDLNHAYGFGRRIYDALVAELQGLDGARLVGNTFIIGGPERPLQQDVGLCAKGFRGGDDKPYLEISTRLTAQYVCIELNSGEPEDSWFHLAAGQRRLVGVRGLPLDASPRGGVRALNSTKRVRID